jgi:hypothetical protein
MALTDRLRRRNILATFAMAGLALTSFTRYWQSAKRETQTKALLPIKKHIM